MIDMVYCLRVVLGFMLLILWECQKGLGECLITKYEIILFLKLYRK